MRGWIFAVVVAAACEHRPRPVGKDAMVKRTNDAAVPGDAPIDAPSDAPIDGADAPTDARAGLAFADVPTVGIDDEKALLVHLGKRMFVNRDAPWPRVAAAKRVVHATVTRFDVVARGKTHDFELELAVIGWLVGTGPTTIAIHAPAPDEETSADAPLPMVGASGIFLLDGKARFERREPVALPVELAPAIGLAGDRLVAAVRDAKGVALELALGAATRSRDPATKAALVERASRSDAEALLARAALYALGDRQAALANLELDRLSQATLHALGIFAVEKDGARLGILGPEPTIPLRWRTP